MYRSAVWMLILFLGTHQQNMELQEPDINKRFLKMASLEIASEFRICVSNRTNREEFFYEFINFWDMKRELLNTDMGCLAVCIAARLYLISPNLTLIEPTAKIFVSTYGGDDETWNTLNNVYNFCYNTIHLRVTNMTIPDCSMMLEFLRCFRDGVNQLGWVPDVSDLIRKEIKTFLPDPPSNQWYTKSRRSYYPKQERRKDSRRKLLKRNKFQQFGTAFLYWRPTSIKYFKDLLKLKSALRTITEDKN